jgi:hypothetical protein
MQRVKPALNRVGALHDWYLLKFENHHITQIPGCQLKSGMLILFFAYDIKLRECMAY